MKLTIEVPDTTVAITLTTVWSTADAYLLKPYCFHTNEIMNAANGETLIATPRPKAEEDE